MFRYQASAALSINITRGFLLNLLSVGGHLSNGTAFLSRISSGVKLNRIEIRAPTASTDVTVATATVEWLSSLGPTSEVSDSGTPLHPLFISTSPPSQSLAGYWSLTGTNESENLFLISVPTGAFVDVWVDMILQDAETPVLQTPGSAPTDGAMYALALDGISSNKLVPVSYLTIS
jgi:hypothetical protein